MASFMATDTISVGEYIERCRMISVPQFQRSYAWTEDEVLQLWQDILGSMKGKRPEYFIGPIVVEEKDAAPVKVVDGQQRLATIMIILNTLRQEFRRHGDSERADVITSTYFIGKKDIKTLQADHKLVMNSENGEIYRNYIGTEMAIDVVREAYEQLPRGKSNRLLLEAALSSNDQLAAYQGQKFNQAKLIDLLEYITEKVMILVLSVKDEVDAYTIFETLNDRGRSLDTLDLLKNHLFSKAKSHFDEVKDKWLSIRDDLNEVDPKNRFLHHYWTATHGQTSTNNLFRNIREEITTAKEALVFVNKMAEAARAYEALQNPGSPFWDLYPAAVKSHIAALRVLDAQQALPMLLSAQKAFQKIEFVKLCRLLVVMAVRYNFIGEGRTGVLANRYSDAAKRITLGEYKKAASVALSLKPIYPTDAEFKADFVLKESNDAKRVRYILACIENTVRKSGTLVDQDPAEVNLEHILPKKQNQHWQPATTGLAKEDYDSFVNRLGNLALVTKGANKAAGSKGFAEKQKTLLALSEFKTTQQAASAKTWNRKAIEARQAYLAEHAVKAWTYPVG